MNNKLYLFVVTWAMLLETEDHIQYSLKQYKNTEVVGILLYCYTRKMLLYLVNEISDTLCSDPE